jgi:two-component system phosphate regulon response regulator OmpR
MTSEGPHILVVDDDDRLRELLRKYLSENGYLVTSAASAKEARNRMASLAFDLIVLDIMMPGETGLSLAASLRPKNETPILMLTAMGETEERIKGLETGADDYLTKPFEPRELLLRIGSILRRAPKPVVAEAPTEVSLGSACFDMVRQELRRGDEQVRLTSLEAALLKALAESPGAILSREELIERTGTEAGGRAVDVQVTRLRRKIEADPKLPRYLQTVRGKGYVLRPD